MGDQHEWSYVICSEEWGACAVYGYLKSRTFSMDSTYRQILQLAVAHSSGLLVLKGLVVSECGFRRGLHIVQFDLQWFP